MRQALEGGAPDLLIKADAPLAGGVSTIVALTDETPILLRPGTIPFDQILCAAAEGSATDPSRLAGHAMDNIP